jgi:hypothetical protein
MEESFFSVVNSHRLSEPKASQNTQTLSSANPLNRERIFPFSFRVAVGTICFAGPLPFVCSHKPRAKQYMEDAVSLHNLRTRRKTLISASICLIATSVVANAQSNQDSKPDAQQGAQIKVEQQQTKVTVQQPQPQVTVTQPHGPPELHFML